MSKLYIFAAVILFWVTLSTSLLKVQLVASPVYKMRTPAYHSMSTRSTAIAQVKDAPTVASYN